MVLSKDLRWIGQLGTHKEWNGLSISTMPVSCMSCTAVSLKSWNPTIISTIRTTESPWTTSCLPCQWTLFLLILQAVCVWVWYFLVGWLCLGPRGCVGEPCRFLMRTHRWNFHEFPMLFQGWIQWMGMHQCHMDTFSWKLFGENSALAACPRDLSAQEASPDIDMFVQHIIGAWTRTYDVMANVYLMNTHFRNHILYWYAYCHSR